MALFGGGILALLLFLLWVYCIFDVISTDETLVRNMPKVLWLIIVIFLPTVGSVAWLVLGRPERAGLKPGDTTYLQPPRRSTSGPPPKGPDDSPEFLAGLDDRARELKRWEDDLKRREDEIRRREEGQ